MHFSCDRDIKEKKKKEKNQEEREREREIKKRRTRKRDGEKKKRKERGDFINERLAKGKERIKWINMYEDKLMEEAKRKKEKPKTGYYNNSNQHITKEKKELA